MRLPVAEAELQRPSPPSQGLAYMGYVTLNWSTVHKDIIRRLDVNHEGKFDASDMKSLAASGLAVLAQVCCLPCAAHPCKQRYMHGAAADAWTVACKHALCTLPRSLRHELDTGALCLAQGVPSTGGFLAGFALGLK